MLTLTVFCFEGQVMESASYDSNIEIFFLRLKMSLKTLSQKSLCSGFSMAVQQLSYPGAFRAIDARSPKSLLCDLPRS